MPKEYINGISADQVAEFNSMNQIDLKKETSDWTEREWSIVSRAKEISEENKPVVLEGIQTNISMVQEDSNLSDEERVEEFSRLNFLSLCLQISPQTLHELSKIKPSKRRK